jgi:hypothetical protein
MVKLRPWTKDDIRTTYATATALVVMAGMRLLVMLTRVLVLLT